MYIIQISWYVELKTEFTVLDRRKSRSGRRVRVRTARNIAADHYRELPTDHLVSLGLVPL